MTDTGTASTIPTLDSWDLRDAAQTVDEYAPVAADLLGLENTHFAVTANQLRELAVLKENYDAEKLAVWKAELAAKAAEAARIEALTVAVHQSLSRFATRRAHAETLVALFDITPKAV